MTLAVAATASQPEKANAVALDLNFANFSGTSPISTSRGPGFLGQTIDFTNVATNVDARVTATMSGANYSFGGHIPNYLYTNPVNGAPGGDLASQYQIAANQTGAGTMTYKLDLFESGTNFTTAFTAPELRFLVYDVDGESDINGIVQTEAVRVFKNDGLVAYQVGNTPQALSVADQGLSYLFSGQGDDVAETDTSGAAIFYFQNTNSVTFQFEANTLVADSAINRVFSSLDGDLSLLNGPLIGGFNPTTSVPEPFTVIGTLVGGTAAFRMRKKLKDSNK
jgi:hypothetical protein